MGQVWVVDFEDSFTYNIAAELEALGLECEVISWTKLRDAQSPLAQTLPQLILLGPGPGHPDEYGMGPRIATWWTTGVPMAGICLGHQFIGRLLGLKVERSQHPIHGQRVAVTAPPSWISEGIPQKLSVQRYNSLALPVTGHLPPDWEGWQHEGEWIGLKHPRAISYQFHPESVGTSCPSELFRPLSRLTL